MASAAAERPSTAEQDAYCCTMPDTLSNTYRHTEAVKRLAIHRDTTTARDIWHRILERDSTYAPANYYLSLTETPSEDAIRYAYRAFAADSTNKWYAENYARQLVTSRHYARAIPIYRRLMRLDSKNLQAYHALAILYGSSGMPYSAIAILDSAEIRIGYNPYLAEIQQQLLLDTRQYDRAIEAGRRRVEEHPYDSDVRTSLAAAYDAAGRDSMARITYEEAFRLDTTDLTTIVAIVDYYYAKGDTRRMLDYETRLFLYKHSPLADKEQRLLQYINDIDFYRENYHWLGSIILGLAMNYPTNRTFINAYAMHLIGGGETAAAYDYLLRHIDDETTTPDDYIMLLQYMQFIERDDTEVEAMLDRAYERFGDNDQLLSFEGFYYVEREDYGRALKLFKRGLKQAKRLKNNELCSYMLGSIGDIYHIMGKSMRSFMAYADALHYNPDNVAVLNNYAYFLSLTGRGLDKALPMAERAVELEKSNATYIDTYAWILHLLGRNDEAKRAMLRALSLDGQRDPDIIAHYGDILWSLGEKFMAETYWQKAIDRGYDKELMEQHILEIKEQTTK